MTEAEVYETKSGLAVVTQDAESARKDVRKARRTRNRLKAARASQRRTGGSKGKATWMARAKEKHKLGWNPRQTLKRQTQPRPLWKD